MIMETTTNWSIIQIVVQTVLAIITAWMAFETHKMAKATNKALDLEKMPILGFKDVITEFDSTKAEDPSEKQNEVLLKGIRIGLELFNAGRVTVQYKVKKLLVSFANRVNDQESYLSRGARVLPGSSSVFWHPGIRLNLPIKDLPKKGKVTLDCQYSDESGLNRKPLKVTIEFNISSNEGKLRTNWLLVEESSIV